MIKQLKVVLSTTGQLFSNIFHCSIWLVLKTLYYFLEHMQQNGPIQSKSQSRTHKKVFQVFVYSTTSSLVAGWSCSLIMQQVQAPLRVETTYCYMYTQHFLFDYMSLSLSLSLSLLFYVRFILHACLISSAESTPTLLMPTATWVTLSRRCKMCKEHYSATPELFRSTRPLQMPTAILPRFTKIPETSLKLSLHIEWR